MPRQDASRRRRVLILPSWYPDEASPYRGIFIQEQVIALARVHDVAVLYPTIDRWRGVPGRRTAPRTESHEGVLVHRRSALARLPRSYRLAYNAYLRAARAGLRDLVRSWGEPDLIHAHVVLPAGWAAQRLGREFSIPVVLTEHTGPFSAHLDRAWKRRRVREAFAGVDRLLAVSPALAEDMERAAPLQRRPGVVGNLVRTDIFRPDGERALPPAASDGEAATTRFLSVSFLTAEKGLYHLVEAARLLVQRGRTDFEIWIGGDGPERSSLKRAVEEAGLVERIRFLGLLDRAGVARWLRSCDAFVLSSLVETFGVVVCEAMACGKPVIATRCGGPESTVTPEAGTLVEPGDPAALADGMAAFMDDRFRYDPAAIRRSVVERFGEAAFVRRTTAVYDEILNSAGSPGRAFVG